MSISIVMATYNGEKYILDQLESIYNQSVKADEVLIFDDYSTDNTVKIIKRYIKNKKLNNWTLVVNEKNKGWKLNFINGINKASCDYIFLSDQDDIWDKDKLKIMTDKMEKNREIKVLVSKYRKIYFENSKIVINKGSNQLKKIFFNQKWYYIQKPGCVFCIRKDIIGLISNIWCKDYAHDVLIWHLGILFDGLYEIDYSSILFRRHYSNSTPKNYHNNSTRLKNTLIAINEIINVKRFIEKSQLFIRNKNAKINIISKSLEFNILREKLFETKNIVYWFKLIKYVNYYFSFKSFLLDLYCTFK